MKAEPQICLERIRKRDREGEKSISLQYLEKLESLHEKWCQENFWPNKSEKIRIIDANKSEENVKNQVENILKMYF